MCMHNTDVTSQIGPVVGVDYVTDRIYDGALCNIQVRLMVNGGALDSKKPAGVSPF